MVDLLDEALECAKNSQWIAKVLKERLLNTLGSANRFVIYQEFKKIYKEHSNNIDKIYELYK